MLAHLIQHKGNGRFVIVIVLIAGCVVAQLVDAFSWDGRYIGGVTLLLSGIILFLMDNKRKTITEGDIIQKTIKLPREKRKNTLMWIEVRYWAILLAAIGMVWLLSIK